MKKVFLFLFLSLIAVSASFGFYLTSNTANVAWPATTTILQGSSTLSDFVGTAGCNWVILSKGTGGTYGQCTAEAIWYFEGTDLSFETDALTSTPLQVKSTRMKIRLYNSGVGAATPEAFVYAY